MIVCHCNVIGTKEIEEVVRDVSRRDRYRIVTPGTVFTCCGKRPNCGSCMSLIVAMIAEAQDRCEAQGPCAQVPKAVTRLSDAAGVAGLELGRAAGGSDGVAGRMKLKVVRGGAP